MVKHTLWVRKSLQVLTDPQRRVYDGVPFSSEQHWSSWTQVCTYSKKEDAQDASDTFKKINPTREYKVLEEGEKP